MLINTSTMRHSQNWVIDFERMLKRGCKGLREEAQARLAALEHPRDLAYKKPFYEAAIITCDALSLFARRYSELATEMAAKTKDAQRKQGLEEIAAVCAWVPENPARTFREAIQSQWFTQLFSRFEEMIGGDINSGRMDQNFYPTYKLDIEEGRITPEAAKELFQCLWLNIMQCIQSQMSPALAKNREGFSHHETVTIGGQTPDGLDATNEFSYVLLESTRPLRTSYPELGVRIHANTPDKFLHAVAETIKDGIRPYPNVIKYELLPYHRYGETKYGFLGRVYELEDFESLNPETLRRLQAIIDEAFGHAKVTGSGGGGRIVTTQDQKRTGWKQKVLHEMMEYWLTALYMFLFFGVFSTYRRLILAHHDVS